MRSRQSRVADHAPPPSSSARLTRPMSRFRVLVVLAALLTAGAARGQEIPPSQGLYRLPYADGTTVKVFDDARTHRPAGRVDLFGAAGSTPYRVVAAAAGRIVAIQDQFAEQQSGRAA